MLVQEAPDPAPATGMPLLAAAHLQDHLMVASCDLERLQRLLSDACDSLLTHFYAATGELKQMLHAARAGSDTHQLQTVMEHMAGAITAMQFQDMASQLVAHTSRRLRNCADRLARDTFADDDEGDAVVAEPPSRPNPVTQDEIDAGSIELF
jgi:hypothetical protein